MNKPQILILSFALVAVVVLAQVWRSQTRASYTPTPASARVPVNLRSDHGEFAASESVPAAAAEPIIVPAPAPDAGGPPEAAPADTAAPATPP